ncbi:MAG: hypothetical protein VKO21_11310 [Candidatus Sericytochromatia bacterium]|nr:hypothetical protein [Candidatus Sericytochromatia bacterium]
MPVVTRIHRMSLPELAYQLSCAPAFFRIREDFAAGVIDDQEAQARLLDFVLAGRGMVHAYQGEEELRWALSEAESGKLTSMLYLEHLKGT